MQTFRGRMCWTFSRKKEEASVAGTDRERGRVVGSQVDHRVKSLLV